MDRESAERTRREVVRVWKRENVMSEDRKLTNQITQSRLQHLEIPSP